MQHHFASGALACVILALSAPASAQRFVEEARYRAGGSTSLPSTFGTAVALDPATSVIGAPGALAGEGEVLFHDVSGAAPLPIGRFGSDSAKALGASVAVRGSLIVVGAPLSDVESVSQRGLVFVFRRTGTSVALVRSFSAPDSAGPVAARFGAAVAIVGSDSIVVGAPGARTVYWFDAVSGGTFPALRTSTSFAAIAGFGGALAASQIPGMTGTAVAIGSADRTSAAQVTIWIVAGASGTVAGAIPNPGAEIGFGASVAIDGLRVMVGSPIAEIVRIYQGDPAGGTLTLVEHYDGNAGSALGASVALHGETRIAGAPGVMPTAIGDRGEAYALRPDAVFPRAAVRTTLMPALALGTSVSLSGSRLLVGAPDSGGDAILFGDREPMTCAIDFDCAGAEVCVEGFCCNDACGGDSSDDCQTCNAEGGEGWCTYRAAGEVCTPSDPLCTGACTGDATECSGTIACPEPDGGALADAGAQVDAGENTDEDAGAVPFDAGTSETDASAPPPGVTFGGGGGCRCAAAGAGGAPGAGAGLVASMLAIAVVIRRRR